MLRLFALLATLLTVTACTNANDLDRPRADLGNFRLGHNVVVAPNMVKGPVSREATKEEWIDALTTAIDERFSPYEGDKYYHFGVSVEGYVLAIPGIPLVASPKSALIINLTVWDDAAGKKLNEEPEQLTILESISGETLVGSGLTQSREQQIENLSKNAAKAIQNWLRRNPDWFDIGKTTAEKENYADSVERVEEAMAATETDVAE